LRRCLFSAASAAMEKRTAASERKNFCQSQIDEIYVWHLLNICPANVVRCVSESEAEGRCLFSAASAAMEICPANVVRCVSESEAVAAMSIPYNMFTKPSYML